MGLVEVAELAGQEAQVGLVALVQPLDRLVEAGPADHPLGADPHVGGEQALEPAGADAGAVGQLPDPGDLAVGHDLVDDPVDQGHARVGAGSRASRNASAAATRRRWSPAASSRATSRSPSGPNTSATWTRRSVRVATGAPRNGWKPAGRKRIPKAWPAPASRRLNRPGEHALDPRVARLGDQVDAGMGQGVLEVGLAAAQVPADQPEVLDQLGQGRAGPGPGDLEAPLPRLEIEHPRSVSSTARMASASSRLRATAGAVAFVQAFPASAPTLVAEVIQR